MIKSRITPFPFLMLLGFCTLIAAPTHANGQTDDRPSSSVELVDLEVQLHLLVASNASADNPRLAAPLEAIAKELRPVLPFSNYRLGATFLSRVKNGKSLNVKGIGRTLLVTPSLESSVNPTFYEISANTVSLRTDGAGREIVQLSPFRFGLRIPLQMSPARANDGSQGSIGVAYEPVGITTDVTVRQGEAVVVGTLDAGRPNETLVVVLIVKRRT